MENIAEIGVGAAVALLILDRVFSFLKSQKKNNGSAGELPKEYWEKRFDAMDVELRAIVSGLHDIKQSLMILIRWKGGD